MLSKVNIPWYIKSLFSVCMLHSQVCGGCRQTLYITSYSIIPIWPCHNNYDYYLVMVDTKNVIESQIQLQITRLHEFQ